MLERFFGRRQAKDPAHLLERELETLEREAEGTAWDYRAHVFARAGDLCLKAGDRDRALPYYGRAIDAYLEFGYFDVAANVCRKVIEVSPDVVRARCTLAFLSLGSGLLHRPFETMLEEARREILDYVQAARRAGREELAARRLRLMAEATDAVEIRELIAECLLEMDDPVGADAIYGALNAERNLLQPTPAQTQQERWARVLRLSMADPPAADSPGTAAADHDDV